MIGASRICCSRPTRTRSGWPKRGFARNQPIEELQAEATAVGANAVVSIDLDSQVIGPDGAMLMVSASGTAVRI